MNQAVSQTLLREIAAAFLEGGLNPQISPVASPVLVFIQGLVKLHLSFVGYYECCPWVGTAAGVLFLAS